MVIRLPSFFRSLSYSRRVQRLVAALRLSGPARKIYYYAARPRGGILPVEVGSARAALYVRNPKELR